MSFLPPPSPSDLVQDAKDAVQTLTGDGQAATQGAAQGAQDAGQQAGNVLFLLAQVTSVTAQQTANAASQMREQVLNSIRKHRPTSGQIAGQGQAILQRGREQLGTLGNSLPGRGQQLGNALGHTAEEVGRATEAIISAVVACVVVVIVTDVTVAARLTAIVCIIVVTVVTVVTAAIGITEAVGIETLTVVNGIPSLLEMLGCKDAASSSRQILDLAEASLVFLWNRVLDLLQADHGTQTRQLSDVLGALEAGKTKAQALLKAAAQSGDNAVEQAYWDMIRAVRALRVHRH
jgi:hypothetical protein